MKLSQRELQILSYWLQWKLENYKPVELICSDLANLLPFEVLEEDVIEAVEMYYERI